MRQDLGALGLVVEVLNGLIVTHTALYVLPDFIRFFHHLRGWIVHVRVGSSVHRRRVQGADAFDEVREQYGSHHCYFASQRVTNQSHFAIG